ncbi:MAG TPA: LapA family protein, partial [Pseudonocardia sp.]
AGAPATGPVTAGPAPAAPAPAAPVPPAPAAPASPAPAVAHSRTGVLWTGLILSALVLLFLLVFIIQNDQPVLISFFALEGVLPSGVALLLAAIAGVLLGAVPGTLRILQLRRAARRGPR